MADVEFEWQSDPSGPGQKTWNSAALAAEQTSKHALVFSIAEQNFAISADFIEQIVELPKIADVPTAGPTLLGLAEHAGQPIPVVDIAPLLAINSGIEIFRHGLLLNHKGLKVMLAIEAVVVLRELAKEQVVEMPASYLATGFTEYACELTIVDDYTGKSAVGGAGLPNPGIIDEQPEKPSRKQVVVLNVSRLLIAVHNSATQRSVS